VQRPTRPAAAFRAASKADEITQSMTDGCRMQYRDSRSERWAPVDRTQVTSNSIASVGYDPQQHVLEIEFKNGGIYRYAFVSGKIFKRLMEADAKGSYFNNTIRHVFPTTRVK
jgi:hypothetical protein